MGRLKEIEKVVIETNTLCKEILNLLEVHTETPGDNSPWSFEEERKGVVHIGTTVEPVKRLVFNPPVGLYSVAELSFNLKKGPWGLVTGNLHNICWWTVGGKNRNMLGYLNVFGPPKNKIHFRHGLDTEASKQTKEMKTFLLSSEKQRCTLTWDGKGDAWAKVGEFQVGSLSTNQDFFSVGNRGVVVDFGFTGENPVEPMGLDWVWSDVTLRLK